MKKVEKARDCCPLPSLQKTREIPIWHKVRWRHLELEPLCSLESCGVRGGCAAIIVAEALHVLLTTAAVGSKIYDNGDFTFWRSFRENFADFITHPLFLYSLLIFNMITVFMIVALTRAIIRFERLLTKLHWQFDFVALGFNVIAFITLLVAVSSNGQWDVANLVLIAAFGVQIPVQLWAISVVRDCFHFFNLLYVLIAIAEP